LESLETSFHQDLNGDGTIGLLGTIIEATATTALVQVANNYFLDPVAGGSGPELKYQGAPVTSGEFGTYIPLGVEAVSNGYEVAWFDTARNLYSVWSTDANGAYTGNFYQPGPGTSTALEALEPSFQQDLNHDGVIGVPQHTGTAIESIGTTALVQVANNYFLDSVAGGSGPELQYQGAPVTSGEFGAYIPLGVEPVSNGYEVAWFDTVRNLYSVWSTDSSGNYTGNFYQPGPGSSTAFEALEPSFQQDLNGDHTIGIPAHASPAAQAASAAPAVQAPSAGGGDGFAFRADFGVAAGSNNAVPAVLQQIEQVISSGIEHLSTEVQHVIASEVQHIIAGDPTGAHDDTAHGPLFDLLHGFLVH
jgi:serralysin